MNDICRLLRSMKDKKDQIFAMATIIRVDGSAYRREGAKMLIGEDGSYFGTISAGCLEEDLLCQAQEVIKSLHPKNVHYDLKSEDDLSWGQSAGCDGNIEVYIEPIGWELTKLQSNTLLWPYIDEQLNKGFNVVSVKSINSENQGSTILYYDNGNICVESADHEIGQKLNPYMKDFFLSGAKVKLIHIEELGRDFLFERYQPKENLYIFGAGPDAEPLVKIASQLDFSITVIDPRSSRCNEKKFPQADVHIQEHPESFFKKRQIPFDSFVLVMTHNFNRDQEILQYLLQTPLKYLGVLGPKRRTERLVSDKNFMSYIHSPIGLNIGAEGPEEISISVLAELIKVRNHSHAELKKQGTTACRI
ncbi:XdhC family protein [Neobacillus sp. WH10]|uniref:XdhC family protein n=1 Tax=Neobacillus sp. WH10 TaxID=3047873 RepID=UPI0024C197CC|nr:XdhC/CoxI family protein [Neobacillus sp. WH10]WHY77120.1 XdhC family protein [Neobacillus sp. WH10]